MMHKTDYSKNNDLYFKLKQPVRNILIESKHFRHLSLNDF